MFVSLQDQEIPAIESAIKEHAQLSCSCSLVNGSFNDSSQSCSNNILSFSTTFIYAASNGLFTASKIVKQLERDFSQGRNTTLTVNGQQLTVTDNTSQKENNNGILTGLFFAGFISAAILFGIIIIIVMLVYIGYHNYKNYFNFLQCFAVKIKKG